MLLHRFLLAAVALVSLVFGGCGSSSEDDKEVRSASPERELLSRLSAAIAAQRDEYRSLDDVVYADFIGVAQ